MLPLLSNLDYLIIHNIKKTKRFVKICFLNVLNFIEGKLLIKK